MKRLTCVVAMCVAGCSAGYLPAGDGGAVGNDAAAGDALADAGPGCAKSGVDLTTCYPEADIGIHARSSGSSGNRIANFSFTGYRTPMGQPIVADGNMVTVQLADFFDPASTKYAIVLLTAGSRWCAPCGQMTDDLVAQAASYGSKKVVFVQATNEDLDNKPATPADLNGWVGDHGINFTSVLDPGATKLGALYDRAAIPFTVVLDARSMEILYAGTGAPTDLVAFLDKYLAMVKTIPVKP